MNINMDKESHTLFVTDDKEVITFTHRGFCMFVRMCGCHDDCPDNLTMKDWRHTNNTLHEYRRQYLVVKICAL